MNLHDHNTASQFRQTWRTGAVAGFIATIPMTIFMLATQPFLPHGQRYDLPPEIIIKELAHRLHVRYRMSKPQLVTVTLVSHFGYGTTMGVIFGSIGPDTLPASLVQGSLFGLLIWAASYLGLLPLLGVSASAHREPAYRNFMMIAAHLLWGATSGATTSVLKNQHS